VELYGNLIIGDTITILCVEDFTQEVVDIKESKTGKTIQLKLKNKDTGFIGGFFRHSKSSALPSNYVVNKIALRGKEKL